MIYFVEYLKDSWKGLFFDNRFDIKISDYLNDKIYENMRNLKINEKDGTGIFMGSVYEPIEPDKYTTRFTFKNKGRLFMDLDLGIDHAYTVLRLGHWDTFAPNGDTIAYLLEKNIISFDEIMPYLRKEEANDDTNDNPYALSYYKYGSYLLREDITYNSKDFIDGLVAKKEFSEKYILDFVKILKKAEFIHHKNYISTSSSKKIILRQFKMKDIYIIHYIDYMYEHSIYLVAGDVDSFVKITLEEEIEVGNEYEVVDILIFQSKMELEKEKN